MLLKPLRTEDLSHLLGIGDGLSVDLLDAGQDLQPNLNISSSTITIFKLTIIHSPFTGCMIYYSS